METIERPLMDELELLSALDGESMQQLMETIDEDVKHLVDDTVVSVVDELSSADSGGYGNTANAAPVYVEETVDTFWDTMVSGGCEIALDDLQEEGKLSSGDMEDYLYELKDLFERLFLRKLRETDLDAKVLDAVARWYSR